MSEKVEKQNGRLTSQTMNKPLTRSLNSGNKGLPPKINPADYTISDTNQVIANQSSSNTPPAQNSSNSD